MGEGGEGRKMAVTESRGNTSTSESEVEQFLNYS